jgi:hypothetical protein
MGSSGAGQLGDGTKVSRYVPEQVVPSVQPTITDIRLTGPDLLLSGRDGQSFRPYLTLTSTNLAQPLDQWVVIGTNQFNFGGSFTITVSNAVSPNAAQRFYLLQLQN